MRRQVGPEHRYDGRLLELPGHDREELDMRARIFRSDESVSWNVSGVSFNGISVANLAGLWRHIR